MNKLVSNWGLAALESAPLRNTEPIRQVATAVIFFTHLLQYPEAIMVWVMGEVVEVLSVTRLRPRIPQNFELAADVTWKDRSRATIARY